MSEERKRYSAEFKARVALEAIRGELTVAQLVSKHGVRQTLINAWKRQAIEGMTGVFSGRSEAAEAAREGELEKLHAKIGQLVVERDFCARPPVDERRPEAGDGRAGASAAVDRAPVRVGVDQPVFISWPGGG